MNHFTKEAARNQHCATSKARAQFDERLRPKIERFFPAKIFVKHHGNAKTRTIIDNFLKKAVHEQTQGERQARSCGFL